FWYNNIGSETMVRAAPVRPFDNKSSPESEDSMGWLVFWLVADVGLTVLAIWLFIYFKFVWRDWTLIIVGEKGVAVIVPHGIFRERAFLYPEPGEQQGGQVALPGPFYRTERAIFVKLDSDNDRVVVYASMRGSPESTDPNDAIKVVWRLRWSVNREGTPYWRDPAGGGADHGLAPLELVYEGPEGLFVSGITAITAMGKYLEGEFIIWLNESITRHTRALFGGLDVHESVHAGPRAARLFTSYAGFDLTSTSLGELQEKASNVIKMFVQAEMNKFGICILDLTIIDMDFPSKLIDAYRALIAQEDENERLRKQFDATVKGAQRLSEEANASPDNAVLNSTAITAGNLLPHLLAALKQ